MSSAAHGVKHIKRATNPPIVHPYPCSWWVTLQPVVMAKPLLWFGWWKRCKTLAIVRGSFHVVMALKRPAIRSW
ncbi:Uncharacterised protein [Vibrio cholerae]|nr:Uncharacterised protein [Vibrio cholerae]